MKKIKIQPEAIYKKSKGTVNLKVKEWEKLCQANTNQKKAGVTKTISDNMNFIAKKITRDREVYCRGTKKSIHQEDLRNLNIPQQSFKNT